MPVKTACGIHTILNNKNQKAFTRSLRFVHCVHDVHGVPVFNGLCMLLLWIGTQEGHKSPMVEPYYVVHHLPIIMWEATGRDGKRTQCTQDIPFKFDQLGNPKGIFRLGQWSRWKIDIHYRLQYRHPNTGGVFWKPF